MKTKNTLVSVAIVTVTIIAIICIWLISTQRTLVSLEENTKQSWSDVQTEYERRISLIPNLVSVVQGYAKHEKEVLTQITEARSMLLKAKTPQDFEKADEQNLQAMKNLKIVVEAYPQLRASENFQRLSDELTITENRIANARQNYNDSVKDYNKVTKRFPTVLVSTSFGFEPDKFKSFKSQDGAEKAIPVNFNN